MKLSKEYPRRCECGGKLVYTRMTGMVFVYCQTCSDHHPDRKAPRKKKRK